ncbi:hypothetical protein Hypma_001416 [Hypsizygus marmoreus]|uniref:Uncharacterized protein n=1 Tax=Hypsizygus marmoreus TaxID=39966 RepID=A0A369K461_HYPMA|nr:hypothetical protein Hypma_001416 [Hypsizygus marmoreus]
MSKSSRCCQGLDGYEFWTAVLGIIWSSLLIRHAFGVWHEPAVKTIHPPLSALGDRAQKLNKSHPVFVHARNACRTDVVLQPLPLEIEEVLFKVNASLVYLQLLVDLIDHTTLSHYPQMLDRLYDLFQTPPPYSAEVAAGGRDLVERVRLSLGGIATAARHHNRSDCLRGSVYYRTDSGKFDFSFDAESRPASSPNRVRILVDIHGLCPF